MMPYTSAALHLRGYWLIIARVIWFVVAGTAIGFFLAGLPVRLEQLFTTAAEMMMSLRELYPTTAQTLEADLGLALDVVYTVYRLAFELIFVLSYCLVAILIFWRKSDEWMPIIVSLALVTFAVSETEVGGVLVRHRPLWHWPVEAVQAFGMAAILIIFYIVPDGRFVPRWTRTLTFVWTAMILIWFLFPRLPSNPFYWDIWIQNPFPSFLLILVVFGIGVYAQIYRYMRVSNPVQQQQTKWIVYGFWHGVFSWHRPLFTACHRATGSPIWTL